LHFDVGFYMSPELDDALCKRYHRIFEVEKAGGDGSLACFGFECHDGWFNIIDTLCEQIQSYIDRRGCPQVLARQVKEKFGQLRFYHAYGDEVVSALVGFAEALSEKTCELCGSPAAQVSDKGWTRVRCSNHKLS